MNDGRNQNLILCINHNYIIKQNMQFTQIQQISSLMRSETRPNHKKQLNEANDHYLINLKDFDAPIHSEVVSIETMQRNHDSCKKQDFDSKIKQTSGRKRIQSETNEEMKDGKISTGEDKKYDTIKPVKHRNSLLTARTIGVAGELRKVKVSYFNTPEFKLIACPTAWTARNLIQKAVELYLLDNYDVVKASQPLSKYELRAPSPTGLSEADLKMEILHQERILSDARFESLVLVERTAADNELQSKNAIADDQTNLSFTRSNTLNHSTTFQERSPAYDSSVTITLMDQFYFEFIKMILEKEDTLEKVFWAIEQNNLNNLSQFVLKEDPSSENALTPEHEVASLESNTLYIMTKKFMDESQDQFEMRPIRLNSLIPREVSYLPPIGINRASTYEEFEVSKISSIGIALDRILGIDQTKIYNYEREVRRNKKQVSLIQKLVGNDKKSGTRKPYRMIKEIETVKKFQGGIQVSFPDKCNTYLIKSLKVKEEVYRKLDFLIKWHKGSFAEEKFENKNNSQNFSKHDY